MRERRDEDLGEAVLHPQRIRLKEKEKRLPSITISMLIVRLNRRWEREIVLLHDTRWNEDMSRKLAFKWLEPL